MENRFESKNDYYEILGDDTGSEQLKLAIEFFRFEAKLDKE